MASSACSPASSLGHQLGALSLSPAPLSLTPLAARAPPARARVAVRASASSGRPEKAEAEAEGGQAQGQRRSPRATSRRELILQSGSVATLAAIFSFSGTRPNYLGVQRSPPSLALCPATPNCISTSEEINDPGHYVPPWTYNPEDGRGKKQPATQEQALQELVAVVTSTKPDGFEPKIVAQRPDYLYVEYSSPLLGFVDDVEFWFPSGPGSRVEYRSASRLGESDFNINRKRIKALRQELQKYGWASVGY